MLTAKLIAAESENYWKRIDFMRKHATRIDAFGEWLRGLGGKLDEFGEFVDSIVLQDLHDRVDLRLQLCADSLSKERVADEISWLEAVIGQQLLFFPACYSITTANATYAHPELGDITIVVTGNHNHILHQLAEAA